MYGQSFQAFLTCFLVYNYRNSELLQISHSTTWPMPYPSQMLFPSNCMIQRLSISLSPHFTPPSPLLPILKIVFLLSFSPPGHSTRFSLQLLKCLRILNLHSRWSNITSLERFSLPLSLPLFPKTASSHSQTYCGIYFLLDFFVHFIIYRLIVCLL